MSGILTAEIGHETVRSMIPRVVRSKSSEISLADVGEKDAVLKVGEQGLFKLSGGEGKTFRSITGLDFNMLRKLPEEVRNRCWNELVIKRDEDFTFKVRNDKIVSIPKDGPTLPNYETFLGRLTEKVKPEGFANIMMRRGNLSFGMMTDKTFSPPKSVGDVVHSGLFVTFNGEVTAQPYNMRLVCTNGQTLPRKGHSFILSEEDFDNSLNSALEASDKFTQDFISLSERKLENAGGLIGRLSQMKLLNSVQVRQITERLNQLGDEATEYDLINLITVVQHEQSDNAAWLEAGGRATDYFANGHCNKCGASV